MKRILLAAVLAALPVAAFAQSTGAVIRDPATGGAIRDPALPGPEDFVASPPLVRDPAGGVMISDEAGFRTYVMARPMQSYSYGQPVVIGVILPQQGVVYREVPAEYGATGYRYTVVNDQPVIVEPRTRRIVEVID